MLNSSLFASSFTVFLFWHLRVPTGPRPWTRNKWDPPCVESVSHIWLFVTPWAVSHQALLSMGFPRQEYWSGLPFPSPGDLPNPGIPFKCLSFPPGEYFAHFRRLNIYLKNDYRLVSHLPFPFPQFPILKMQKPRLGLFDLPLGYSEKQTAYYFLR